MLRQQCTLQPVRLLFGRDCQEDVSGGEAAERIGHRLKRLVIPDGARRDDPTFTQQIYGARETGLS